MMFYLAFLRGDSAQMKEQLAWGAGKPGDEDSLLSVVLASSSRFKAM
jgi:hypothetical protein